LWARLQPPGGKATRGQALRGGVEEGQGRSLEQSAVDVFAFVTPVLGDPLRADRAESIVVGPCAAHDPRQGGGGGDDEGDAASSDQYRCEHGAVSI
jgi:hypothetical protein